MASVAVKVYGERNTGTNYLEKLVTANLDAYILSGIVPRRDPVTFVTRNLRALKPELFAGWHEKARDWYFARNFSRDLGWKHMCPDVGRIGAEHLGKTRFLMLVKEPVFLARLVFPSPLSRDPDGHSGRVRGSPVSGHDGP